MEWYAFEPAGTLLCKGAEPMDMGADHHASQIFPPPAQTIAGALRTAVLLQNGVGFSEYYSKKGVSAEILQAIGTADNSPPFTVSGPLFELNRRVFVPVPYSWFGDNKPQPSLSESVIVRVCRAEPIQSRLVKSEAEFAMWVKDGSGAFENLGGGWTPLADLCSGSSEKTIHRPESFFTIEPRTGIALNKNRSVRKGHLYTFTHIRLKSGVRLVFGIDRQLPLADRGVIKLGAEQRFGSYEKIPPLDLQPGTSGTYLGFSMVEGTPQTNQAVVATGKIQYIGGWDLQKGFHKPMRGYFPAGSVFSRQVFTHLIQL